MATGNDSDFSAFDPIDPAAPNAAGPDFSFPADDALGDPTAASAAGGDLGGAAVSGGAFAAGAVAGGAMAAALNAADPNVGDPNAASSPAIVPQKGKKDTTPKPKPPKPPANVYLFMLVLSLVFLTLGSVFLVTELKRYNFERVPPTPLR